MDESLTNIRHERSKKDFPKLALEDGEFVEFAILRAKICAFLICGAVLIAFLILVLAFILVNTGQTYLDDMGKSFVYIILFALLAATILGGIIASMIYHGNKLFITNMRVIQMVMNSPVSTSVNIIDLSSVEDVSFRQNGILQKLFGYGTLRLSTVGDETTYTARFVNVAPEDLNSITKLVSAAKKDD